MAPRSERDSRSSDHSRSPRDVSFGGIRRRSHDRDRRHERRNAELHDLRQENAELRRRLACHEQSIEAYEDEIEEGWLQCSSAKRELSSAQDRLSLMSVELTYLKHELAAEKERQQEFEAVVKNRQEDLEAALARAHNEKKRVRQNVFAEQAGAQLLSQTLASTKRKHAQRTDKLRKRFRVAEAEVEAYECKKRLVDFGTEVVDPVRGRMNPDTFLAMGGEISMFYCGQLKPAERPRSSVRRFLTREVIEDELYEVYEAALELRKWGDVTASIRADLVRAVGKARENDLDVPRHIYQFLVEISPPYGLRADLQRRMSMTPEIPKTTTSESSAEDSFTSSYESRSGGSSDSN